MLGEYMLRILVLIIVIISSSQLCAEDAPTLEQVKAKISDDKTAEVTELSVEKAVSQLILNNTKNNEVLSVSITTTIIKRYSDDIYCVRHNSKSAKDSNTTYYLIESKDKAFRILKAYSDK
jgi:hypothetical protein